MSLPHICDNNNYWTVIVGNRTYQFDPEHPKYDKLVQFVSDHDSDGFVKILDTGALIQNWSDGNFKFKNGILLYNDAEVHTVVTDRIVNMIKEEFDYKPMLRFLERLYENPSNRAVNELYRFLMHKNLPITDEGFVLAYKAVHTYDGEDFVSLDLNITSGDLLDKYTGTIRNNVGDTPSMPRNQVQDNANIGCGPGLHLGSETYAKGYGCGDGDVLLICQLDPADVVSIPLDCSCQKMRSCGYKVVGVYEQTLNSAVHSEYTNVYEEDDDEDHDEDDYFDELDTSYEEDDDDEDNISY